MPGERLPIFLLSKACLGIALASIFSQRKLEIRLLNLLDHTEGFRAAARQDYAWSAPRLVHLPQGHEEFIFKTSAFGLGALHFSRLWFKNLKTSVAASPEMLFSLSNYF